MKESSHKETRICFIFGVRNLEDNFYTEEILSIGTRFMKFEYAQYFSRESDFSGQISTEKRNIQNGYVTDWILEKNIRNYEEYYICGSPAMVKSAREKLESFGIKKEQIFWEQF